MLALKIIGINFPPSHFFQKLLLIHGTEIFKKYCSNIPLKYGKIGKRLESC